MFDLFTLIPPSTLAAFLAAGIALNLTPGADVMFATAVGLGGGPRTGAAAGIGVGLGSLVHVILASVGLAAVIATHPSALTAIRWAGGAYLAWLAIRTWRAGAPTADRPRRLTAAQAIAQGFLTNLLNPKVILFILAFLPQFTDPARGPVWAQILILGLLFSLTGMGITATYGALAGRMGAALSRRMSILNRAAAVIFGGLALRLVAGK